MTAFFSSLLVDWTDPRFLFLVGLVLTLVLGLLIFLAIHLERRRLTRESKEANAERLGRAFAGTGLGFWDWDLESGLYSYDEEWFRVNLGYKNPIDELGLDFMGAIMHPDDLIHKNEALLNHLLGKSDSYSVEFRLRRKDGQWVWILSRGTVFERNGDGKALRFAGADSLNNDQKQAREVLQVEKEISMRFASIYTYADVFCVLAEELVKFSDFEFAAAFYGTGKRKECTRIQEENLPYFLHPILDLKSNQSSDNISYLDEDDLKRYGAKPSEEPYSVLLFRIDCIDAICGVILLGSKGRKYFSPLLMEALEQIEAQTQSAVERIKTESFYREGQRNLNSLINSIDELIIILDRDLKIVYVNQVACEELEYGMEEMQGLSLLTFYPEVQKENVTETFYDLISGNLSLGLIPLQRRSGKLLHAEIQLSSGRWEDRDAYFCVIRNSGKREEAAEALRLRDERLRTASRSLLELITAKDMESGLRTSLDLISSVFDVDSLSIWERLGEEGEIPSRMRQISSWSQDLGAYIKLDETHENFFLRELPTWENALRSSRSVSGSVATLRGAEKNYLEENEIQSILIVPIHLRNFWWGIIRAEVRTSDRREWSAGDSSMLEIFGAGLAGLMETSRLQNALLSAKEETEKTNQNLEQAIKHANEMADEASRANRSKSEFLANMSHEIRTPMNAILGFSELLSQQITDPDLNDYITAISSSGKTLLSLINDLLDLSKIEAGKMTLEYEPVSALGILDDIERIFRIRCQEKGLQLNRQVSSKFPAFLLLDEVRLRQILFNLVGNALKFTHEGEVTIHLRAEKSPEEQNIYRIIIAVQDTGIGITKEDQSRIFLPFEQSKGQRQKEYGGTGLGLSITRRVVEMLGGELILKSEAGKGSTFTVILKNVESVSPSPALEKKEETNFELVNQKICSSKRIWVVDNNPLNRKIIISTIEGRVDEVKEFSSGEECLDELDRTAKVPDLIFMDLMLPEKLGEEVIHEIRCKKSCSEVKIVACTAMQEERIFEVARRVHLDDVLIKPFAQSQIWRIFHSFWGEGTMMDEDGNRLEAHPTEVSTSPQAAPRVLNATEKERMLTEVQESLLPMWRQLTKRLQVSHAFSFVARLQQFAQDWTVTEIADYAKALEGHANKVDVHMMRLTVSGFPSLLQNYLNENEVEVSAIWLDAMI